MVTRPSVFTIISATLLSIVCSQPAFADDSQPMAIRHWPGGGITVESMWNLSVGIGIDAVAEKTLPKKLDFKLEDMTTQDEAFVGRAANAEKTVVIQGLQDKEAGAMDLKAKAVGGPKNRILIAKTRAADGLTTASFRVQVGQSSLWILMSPPEAADLTPEADKEGNFQGAIDASRIDANADTFKEIADAMKPALMIVPRSVTKVGDADVEAIEHNTVAAAAKEKYAQTRFVSLGDKPYQMSDELEALFANKDAACQASQEFFAKLSVEQMNFKPANGTHTPRWNPEHMMGRELLFFSQIYHAVDPTIPVMNLNPQQNPKDYKFAHPKWSGAEEARQMNRVQAFTRRFAYLLDSMNLDKRAKGSRFWTPRKLLVQMVRHYGEHTANVKKKMELPGWPKK